MAKILETRNIFIDTGYFDSTNYDFEKTALKELVKHVKNGKAKVFLTSVTVGEMRAHLNRGVKEANTALKKFRKEGQILYNIPELPIHGAFVKLDTQDVTRRLQAKMDTFLKEASIEILDLQNVPPEKIFVQYFNMQAPFGDGKKKSEFPDAFAMEALEIWCEQNKQKIYVCSEDSDWQRGCKESTRLICLAKVDEFIDRANRDEKEELARQARRTWDQNIDRITTAVQKEFEWTGFALEDEDGDVNEVEVSTLKLGEPSILEVDEGLARFSVLVSTEFTASVTYNDYTAGSYDHEDNMWLSLPERNETCEEDTEFEAEISLEFKPDDPDYINVLACFVPFEIGVTVNPTDMELK
jgi:hypothetical protein